MAFRALIVRKDDDAASAAVEYITHNQLLETIITDAHLEDLPSLGRDILKGQVKGRVVVDVNA